jgi:hypothetical protein
LETILLEVPMACKDLVPCLEITLSFVASLVAAGQNDDPFCYADVEHAVASAAAELQRNAHAVLLRSMARHEPRLLIGGVVHRALLPSETTYYTLAGPVVVERTLYRPLGKNQGSVDPIALRVGAVRNTWCPGAAGAMAFLVQQGTAREAESTAQQLGVLPYSDTSFHRVAHAVGTLYQTRREEVEEQLIAAYAVPPSATGIAVSLDRSAVAMEEPRARPRGRPKKGAAKRPVTRAWRMAYCATVSLHDKDGKAIHTLRYGRMPQGDTASLVEALFADVRCLRRKRPDLQVAVLCDGAPEMWNLLGTEFTEEALGTSLRHLVDLWHLLEKVGKALRARYDEQRTAREVQRWKLRLLNSSQAAAALQRALEELLLYDEPRTGKHKDAVDEAVTYLRNQGEAGRLDYAAARRAGQPVGSGPAEATCKSAIGVRFKRSGARWKEPTGATVLDLRMLQLSNRWNPAIEGLLGQPGMEVRRVA